MVIGDGIPHMLDSISEDMLSQTKQKPRQLQAQLQVKHSITQTLVMNTSPNTGSKY